MMNLYIKRRMKLNTCNLIPEILMLHGNIIDMVAVDLTEDTAHMSHDTVLAAIVDHIITDNMRTHRLLAPPDMACPENRLHLVLISRFPACPCAQIMSGGFFLANTDPAAFRIMDNIILNYPAPAPVCTQKPRLVCRRRRPRTGRLCHLKSGDRNIVSSCLNRIETAFAHIDLHQFLIGIRSLEIRINSRCLVVCLTAPLINRIFRMQQQLRMIGPRRIDSLRTHNGILHLFQSLRFIERSPVQIYLSGMKNISFRRNKPVTAQYFPIRIVITEHAVWQYCFPDRPFHVFPAGNTFGTLNHDLLSFRCPVHDTVKLAAAPVFRFHPFPVLSGMYNHRIARHRQRRRF